MYKKPNHFKSSELWRGFKKKNVSKGKSRANHVDQQLLSKLPSEEDSDENISMPQSPRSLNRQFSIDINADVKDSGQVFSPEEKSSSEPLSNPSLEWDQENLALNNNNNLLGNENNLESFEMTSRETGMSVLGEIAGDKEYHEEDKLLADHNSFGNVSSDNYSLASNKPAQEKKLSKDKSKHLYLAYDLEDEDKTLPYSQGNLENIPELDKTENFSGINNDEHTPSHFKEEYDDTPRRSCENNERIGYTDFDSMCNTRRSSPFISSPVLSGSNRSPVHSIPVSPIQSTRGSIKRGFSELPFRNSLTDSLGQSRPTSPRDSSKKISPGVSSKDPRDNRENSGESTKLSEGFLHQEIPKSPRNVFSGTFSKFGTPCRPVGSLKEGHNSRRGLARKGPLRRTMTEFNSPSGSNSSLNEKPLSSPRRRKVSAVMQPPTIFAPLVTNVNSPYKDFVPPVRESAITCDCESAEQEPGLNCRNCLEKETKEEDSDHTEDNSEDQTYDFYNNMENIIADYQRQSSSNKCGDYRFEDNDGDSNSLITQTSEHSFTRQELKSDPSQKIDDLSTEYGSIKDLGDHFEQPFPSYSSLQRRPSISGAYSTHCIDEKEEIPESDDLGEFFRPMRTSFSEPHLSLRLPLLPGNNGRAELGTSNDEHVNSLLSDDTATRNLEEIFKDVYSTKEAIETLETILKSPEPDIVADLSDTKHTVQKLDEQVLNLNREVASLSSDVKTVLELLKGLKNGHVTV